jgi:hypothetical protein
MSIGLGQEDDWHNTLSSPPHGGAGNEAPFPHSKQLYQPETGSTATAKRHTAVNTDTAMAARSGVDDKGCSPERELTSPVASSLGKVPSPGKKRKKP